MKNHGIPLKIKLFGTPQIFMGGEEVFFQRRKVLALLIYLVVNQKHIARDLLIDILFPNAGRDRARANFRQTLSVLKSLIGEERLHIDNLGISMNFTQNIEADVFDFLELEKQTFPADAEKLYKDDFLAGFYLENNGEFEDWLFNQQEIFRNKYIAILDKLIVQTMGKQDLENAVSYTKKRLDLDLFSEDYHRLLMELYYRSGQISSSIKQYEKCREILKNEFSSLPDKETEDLYMRIRNRSVPLAPIHSLQNIPEYRNNIIGRETEIGEIRSVISDGNVRILTITGCGGVGKTRLALTVTEELSYLFPDGIFFVDLSVISRTDQIVKAIAQILGIKETIGKGMTLSWKVQRHLENKELLLVLDNFEHLIDGGSEIVLEFVKQCPGIKMLITSRESLHLKEERVFTLLPFSVPEQGDYAIALFEEVTRLIRPDFAANEENLPYIHEICRQLDGLPLAIELAASRMKILGCKAISERLSCRIELLVDNSPRLPLRQQSLATALDWSFSLLMDVEKTVFKYLSLFPGGGSVNALESICKRDSDFNFDVLEILYSLSEKNLILLDINENETRFHMLETIREYAQQMSSAGKDINLLRAGHADYFLKLAQNIAPELHGPDQIEKLNILENDVNNLNCAIEYFYESGHMEKCLQMAIALKWFWFRHGHFSVGRAYLEKALSSLTESVSNRTKARALNALGWMTIITGNWSESRDLQVKSLDLFRKLGDPIGEISATSDLGTVLRWLGDYDEGNILCLKAIDMARSRGKPHNILYALIWAFSTTGGVFSFSPPVQELEEALDIARQLGDYWGIFHSLLGLAELYRQTENYNQARPLYEESLKGFTEIKDDWMIAWNLEGLGRVLYLDKQYGEAEKILLKAFVKFDLLGDKSNALHILSWLGMTANRLGNHHHAARVLASFDALYKNHTGKKSIDDLDLGKELLKVFAYYKLNYPSDWTAGKVYPYKDLKLYLGSVERLWNGTYLY